MTRPTLDAALLPDETILWRGAAITGARVTARKQDVLAGLVGIAAYLLLWGLHAYITGPQAQSMARALIGIAIVSVMMTILGLSLYHIGVKHRRATRVLRRSQYAITNQRALLLEPGRKAQVNALVFSSATNMELDNIHPVTLSLWQSFEGGNREAQLAALQFRHLADADEPARIIRDILEGPTCA